MLARSLTGCGTLLRNSLEKRIGAIFLFNQISNYWACWSPSNLLYDEDFILVELLVKRELPSLPEGLSAALVWTLEWFLTCVNVGVFFQILAKSELLIANHACESLGRFMSRNMSAK